MLSAWPGWCWSRAVDAVLQEAKQHIRGMDIGKGAGPWLPSCPLCPQQWPAALCSRFLCPLCAPSAGQAGGNPSSPGDGLLLMSTAGVEGQGPPVAAAFELHPVQMTWESSVNHPQCRQLQQELLLGASHPNMQIRTC